jgi:ribokinase
MESLLSCETAALRYDILVGTGGIGTGRFFLLRGNHTLGREESRGGIFLERWDYCKLHIICHYVKALLGERFAVLPIGRVGEDEAGRRVLAEMKDAGLDLRYVDVQEGKSTLFSFCYVYPDGSGGNLTTEDSASAAVTPAYVRQAEQFFARCGRRGIAVAAPEVPLEARAEVLELGTRYGLFRAASFTSAEIEEVCSSELLTKVDLLALNRDEALSIVGNAGPIDPADPFTAGDKPDVQDHNWVEQVVSRLSSTYPRLLVSITAGAEGSWSWDGKNLGHVPPLKVPVATTGGAGDAHLAGMVAGLACGLELNSAQRMGVVLASASVTSPHTIHKGITRGTLRDLYQQAGFEDRELQSLLRKT